MLHDSTANPTVKIWEMSIYDKIIQKLIIYNSAYSTNSCVIVEYWKVKNPHMKGNVLQYKILICVTVRLYFHMWGFASLTLIMYNHKHIWVLWAKAVEQNFVSLSHHLSIVPQESVCTSTSCSDSTPPVSSHTYSWPCLTPATVEAHFLAFFGLFWDACRCTTPIPIAPLTIKLIIVAGANIFVILAALLSLHI